MAVRSEADFRENLEAELTINFGMVMTSLQKRRRNKKLYVETAILQR